MKLRWLIKNTTYLIAFFILVIAFCIAAAKLMSPVLNKHRDEFAQSISQKINAPVSIEQVSIGWYEYFPEIRLENVIVLDNDKQKVALKIDRINIFISLWKSLWQRQPVMTGLMVKGTSVNIHQNAQGELIVQGLPPIAGSETASTTPLAKAMDVMNLLSTPRRLILKDIDIRYKGFNQAKRFVTINQLSFLNRKTKHRIVGQAILHQDVPTEIRFASKWQGTQFDPEQIKAKGYLYISGLDLSQWLNHYTLSDWEIKKGVISSKLWFDWKHNKFQKIQTITRAYNLDLYSLSDQAHHPITRLSGNFGWKRVDNRFEIAGDDIIVDLPNHLWPVSSFYLTLDEDAQGKLTPNVIKIGYLDIDDALKFIAPSDLPLSTENQNMLAALNPQGHVENTVITFSREIKETKETKETTNIDWQNITVNTKFSHISFNEYGKIPGLQNVTGALQWHAGKGIVNLNSRHMQYSDKNIFPAPLTLQNISGSIHVAHHSTGWVFSPNLKVMNTDLDANINGDLNIQADGTPIANLSADFSMNSVKSLTAYLPTQVFSENLSKWLKQAFLSGQATDGKALLKGDLSKFPFTNDGTLLISAKLKQVLFRFSPSWPLINDINGDIVFANRTMKVSVTDANMLDMPLQNVTAEIPQLGATTPPELIIQGHVPSDFARALNFIRRSPLKTSVGAIFQGMQLQGPLSLNLGLNIPLYEPTATKVNGELTVQDATMDMKQWGLQLTDLKGSVKFTEASTSSETLTGTFFNKPVQLKLATEKGSNNTRLTKVIFNSHIAIADLQEWLKVPFEDYANGDTDVRGEIAFGKDIPLEIRLTSDLKGIALQLPQQYSKTADEKRAFSANIFVQEKQPLKMRIAYNNLASIALLLDKKNQQQTFSLLGASVNIGDATPAAWPAADGLYLTAHFNQLDLDQLKTWNQSSDSNKLPNIELKQITLNANRFDLYGRALTKVRLRMMPTEQNYSIDLNSDEAVGQIQIPKKFTANELITVQLQRLLLTASDNQTKKSPINFDISTLPSIVFNANQVDYDGMQLGQISFNTRPSAKGLTIQSLRILSPTIDLQGSGEWIQTKGGSITQLSGNVNSKRVSDAINALGGQGSNFVANSAKLNFNLRWDDAPYAPEFASLDGTAAIDIGKGRIIDVGKSTNAKMDFGRMLSIFSLQSIPRRLTLDFSDLFQKGYSFDYFRGDFKFDDGTAKTDNLRFDGPVAGINIKGWIDFKNNKVNLALNVTPYVTSSIPVAATLLTGQPLIGLAALAVNSVVSKVTTYNYFVTGSLSNPSWQASKSSITRPATPPTK